VWGSPGDTTTTHALLLSLEYPAIHVQLVAALLATGEEAKVGHVVHKAVPVDALNVPASHAAQEPLGPV